MPSQKQLREAGRCDVLGAVLRRGGASRVATLFGWKCRRPNRGSFSRLVAQLRCFNRDRDLPSNRLPSLQTLLRANRHDLLDSIARFGGFTAVQERLRPRVVA